MREGKRNQFHAVIFQHFYNSTLDERAVVCEHRDQVQSLLTWTGTAASWLGATLACFCSCRVFAFPLNSLLLLCALLFLKQGSCTSEVEMDAWKEKNK